MTEASASSILVTKYIFFRGHEKKKLALISPRGREVRVTPGGLGSPVTTETEE